MHDNGMITLNNKDLSSLKHTHTHTQMPKCPPFLQTGEGMERVPQRVNSTELRMDLERSCCSTGLDGAVKKVWTVPDGQVVLFLFVVVLPFTLQLCRCFLF